MIQHTWIGDISIILQSPNDLKYLVMADFDNAEDGCGNMNYNANVHIELGTGNPLTENTEYVCNGNPNPCLEGD